MILIFGFFLIYLYLYFFSTQFNNNKKKYLSKWWVQLDPCGLDWTYVMDLVGLNFFLTHHGGLGQKLPLTRPNPTHAHPKTEITVLLKRYEMVMICNTMQVRLNVSCKMGCIHILKLKHSIYCCYAPIEATST